MPFHLVRRRRARGAPRKGTRARIREDPARGGISGLLTFFAAKNPSARIGLVFGLPWIRVPVGAVLLLWACLQLPELIFQLQGNTDVAATAHLGGAIAGTAFFFLYRKL